MQTLFVQFQMKSPVAFGLNGPVFPLVFDSLLTWLKAVEKWGPGVNDRLPETFEEIEIPVEEAGERLRYYQASAWEPYPAEKIKIGCHFWVKSTNWLNDLQCKLSRKEVSSLMRYEGITYLWAPYINFYVNGSRKDIEKLLFDNQDYISLGAHKTMGWGRVKKICVIDIGNDQSFFPLWDINGRPARPMPVDDPSVPPEKIVGCPVALMPYRPPYWLRKNMVPCVLPPLDRWWKSASAGMTDYCLEKLEDELWQKEQLLLSAEQKLADVLCQAKA